MLPFRDIGQNPVTREQCGFQVTGNIAVVGIGGFRGIGGKFFITRILSNYTNYRLMKNLPLLIC